MEDLKKELVERRKNRDAAKKAYTDFILNMKTEQFIKLMFKDEKSISLNSETSENYQRWFKDLNEKGVLYLHRTVRDNGQESKLIVHKLMANTVYSPMQKKLRMHALISLFSKMHQETSARICKLKMPSVLAKIGPMKSRERSAATYDESMLIINAAREISFRDSLVLELIHYTEQPLQTVLGLKCEDIDFDTRIIMGKIADSALVERLKKYIEETSEIRKSEPCVFISNQGRPIFRTQVQKTLEKANKKVQLPFSITTKMIQKSHESERIK